MNKTAVLFALGALLLAACPGSAKVGSSLDGPSEGLAIDGGSDGDTRDGGDAEISDGSQSREGTTDRGAEDARPAETAPDATQPQPLCLPPGPAPETPPASLGGDTFVRAGTAPVRFCVEDENTPGKAFGDAECAKLGAEYSWRPERCSFDQAQEAAKGVCDPVQLGPIQLVAAPAQSAYSDTLLAESFNVTFYGDTADATGSPIYSPDCVPNPGWSAHLLCTKDAQRALVVDGNGADLGVVGAYDAALDQYVVAYSRNNSVYIARIDAYGQASITPQSVSSFSAFGETPKPRLAVSAASNVLLSWQEGAGSTGQVATRYALFGPTGDELVAPRDYLPFGCYNSRGQHAVAYDRDSDRFLVAANCDGTDHASAVKLFVQVYDASSNTLSGLRPRLEIASKFDATWGFQSTDSLYLAYSTHDRRYLILDDGERIVLDQDGAVTLHEAQDPVIGRPWALAAHDDAGGYRLTLGNNGNAASLALNAAGAVVGQVQAWTASRVTTSRFLGGLAYVPQSSPSAFAGKFLAATGARYKFLNDDGATCYPPLTREFVADGDEGVIVLNSETGGFARFSRTSAGLLMRVFLSTGDAY